MPDIRRPPTDSMLTCPSTSISSAVFTATRSRPLSRPESCVTSMRSSTARPLAHSYSRGDPTRYVPSGSPIRSPRSARSTTASVMMPESTATGRSRAPTSASPIAPGPNWMTAPDGTSSASCAPMRFVTSSWRARARVVGARRASATTTSFSPSSRPGRAASGKASLISTRQCLALATAAAIQDTSLPNVSPREVRRALSTTASGRHAPASSAGSCETVAGTYRTVPSLMPAAVPYPAMNVRTSANAAKSRPGGACSSQPVMRRTPPASRAAADRSVQISEGAPAPSARATVHPGRIALRSRSFGKRITVQNTRERITDRPSRA